MAMNSTGFISNNTLFISTEEKIPTRGEIIVETEEVWIESCTISWSQTQAVLGVVLAYGIILTLFLCFKGMRTFHVYNMSQSNRYNKMLFCDRIGEYFKDFAIKRNVYIIILLHIWNQATDLGVIVEMYYLSFSECSLVCINLFLHANTQLIYLLIY